MRTMRILAAMIFVIAILATASCGTSSGTTSVTVGVGVGVYGNPWYGPGPWGGYPYPGRYPPGGGSVWIGVPICC